MGNDLRLFVRDVPVLEIREGMVHARTRFGDGHFERVMSIATFRKHLNAGTKLLEEWDSRDKDPVPISAGRRR
jgi:hypothetical protein